MDSRFTVVAEACICAPEDRSEYVVGVFDTIDEAVAEVAKGKWIGDVARIMYGSCCIGFSGDWFPWDDNGVSVKFECDALRNAIDRIWDLEHPRCEDDLDDIPF